MTIPSAQPAGEPLSMTVEDVFHIKGRGTVIVGTLAGDGLLTAGDVAEFQGQSWRVDALQLSGAAKGSVPAGTSVSAGTVVGVLMKAGPGAGVLRGQHVQFTPRPLAGRPGTGRLMRRLARRQH